MKSSQKAQFRKVKILSMGKALASQKLSFGGQARYRLGNGQTILDLAQQAGEQALRAARLTIRDIDCIVCAMATPLQAIPCNGALVHERMAKGLGIPSMDINTTCTSFISALDVLSYMIASGRYNRVLILSGDTASAALNPNQKESYELFSDGATACILARAEKGEDSAILYSSQKTWSEGAHDTEIRGGCGLKPAFCLNEGNQKDYYFDMKGPRILKLCAKKLPSFLEQSFKETGISRRDIRLVIPHQASKALGVIMPRLGFPAGTYIDLVSEYGNLVSASVPFALCKTIEEGKIQRGDLALLLGTAAGLTANLMLLRY